MTILVIRAWLAATGYPQIGGDGLHIAHMLFGGIGMLIALLMCLTLLGHRSHEVAALIGGIGFGAFIDELGKFITSDNNYFYRPTVALIYVIFVLLFIASDRLTNDAFPSPTERLAQAVGVVGGAVGSGLTVSERSLALRLLAQSDPSDPLVPALQAALRKTDATPDARPGIPARFSARITTLYGWTVGRPWFLRSVIVVAGLAIVFSLRELATSLPLDNERSPLGAEIDSTDGLLLIANLIAGGLLAAGLIQLRTSRLEAYRWFRRATLVSLLIAQPLAFYEQQWTALIGLAFSLVFLSALNFGIERELMLSQEEDADFP